MDDPTRDDLDARLDELEATLDALRQELDADGDRPRPPGPGPFLRLADDYAIPAAISAMEANIRALEFLQAGIRATEERRGRRGGGRSTRDRARDAGRGSLNRLDRALSELESALSGSGLPASREARELLAEARRLNAEVGERVASGREAPDDAVRIDVESELDAIRDEVGDDDADDEDA